MKVLIVGAGGQLGQEMTKRLGGEHEITAWARQELDLTRHQGVREAIRKLAPEAVVNCSGYNQVDAAEDDQRTALEVNAMAVGTLARAAAEVHAVFLHYSTDFVFAGTASTPYTEVERPEPRSVYAQSKLIGEWLAADAPEHYVLRVESLFGGSQRKSSIDRIAHLVRAGEPAPVFVDRVVSPSFVVDVSDASAFILKHRPATGLYHCVNTGYATWKEVGDEIARIVGASGETLKPVFVKDVPMKAPRPQFAALSNEKLTRAGYAMPSWQDAIRRYLTA